jgi:AmmeMemoRadiSam system protein B
LLHRGSAPTTDLVDREPAVAGTFYPGTREELSRSVATHLGPSVSGDDAIAVIAPHAGYVYSGAVAGTVYASVRVPEVAIVLGPNHTGLGTRAAVITSGGFRIPGATIPIASELAVAIRDEAKLHEDDRAHLREHSLEVQLPFLAFRNPSVSIVPICLGVQPFEACVRLGEVLARAIRGRSALLVASTDMSHYLSAAAGGRLDRMALDRIEALDPEGLYRTVFENEISMCGVIPTTVTLVAANALGAKTARLTRYANSGEVSGDYDRVVGYAGFVIR